MICSRSFLMSSGRTRDLRGPAVLEILWLTQTLTRPHCSRVPGGVVVTNLGGSFRDRLGLRYLEDLWKSPRLTRVHADAGVSVGLTTFSFSENPMTPSSIRIPLTYRLMNYGDRDNDPNLQKLFGRLGFDQSANTFSNSTRSLSFHVSGRWIDGGL